MTTLTVVPEPSAPAKVHHPILFATVLLSLAFMTVAGIYLIWQANTPSTPTNQVADTGLLHAHYQGSVVTCDPSSATAWNDARQGTGGQVNVQGPAVVIVDVGVNGRTRELQQQITKNDNVMTWDIPLYARADTITIAVKTNTSYDTCQIATPESPGITRSRGLYGVVG